MFTRQVAIIGAGPSGFYTAQNLLKLKNIKVTIFEKRVAPFGLVRYGVAPDHPEVKNVTSKFESISLSKNVNYVGNVNVGKELCIEELKKAFDAVVFCTGSSGDRRLNVDGEDTGNVWSGREFVGWYNGDPECAHHAPNLISGDTAVILGHGNVALDCARLLLSPIEHLEKTDISPSALDALKKRSIKHVHVVGRRGVLQASFTSKEIRELVALPNTQFKHGESMIPDITKHKAFLDTNRPKKRLMAMLAKESDNSSKNNGAQQTWNLQFLSTPTKIIAGTDGQIVGMEYEQNQLIPSLQYPENILEMNAKGTGTLAMLQCSLLIKCIGYTNSPIAASIPFDFKNGVVPNHQGRVVATGYGGPDGPSTYLDGIYVAGWIKTGPVGVLTSTLYDASETARSVVVDLENLKINVEKRGLEALVKQPHWINFQDWLKVDKVERERGAILGKEREKVTDNKEMFELAISGSK